MDLDKRVFQNGEFSGFSRVYDKNNDACSSLSGPDSAFAGSAIHYFRQINSTSIKAFELAQCGAPEGTVVVAESQSGGKGRRGRVWHSPEGENIYASIILRPQLLPSHAPKLTLVAAVALAEVISAHIEGTSTEEPRIKWPNDILIGDKKCAGILTEMKCNSGRVEFVVIGIGINVNMAAMPPEISALATSLCLEKGKPLSRVSVFQNLYSNMENWYKRYLLEGFPPVRERWNALSGIIGKYVRAASKSDAYEEGRAMGISEDGALLLEKHDGSLINVTVGDINIL